MSIELRDLMKKYGKVFGDGFPTIPLAWAYKDDELCDIIKKCLEEKKDAYELGYVTTDEGVIY